MKKALITGTTGQDGSYLAEFLLSKGYDVYGMVRRNSQGHNPRIENIQNKIKIVHGDLTDSASLVLIIDKIKPDEVYNLGAQSFVKLSWDSPQYTTSCTGQGAANLLNVIRQIKPDTKFYQASSSEMFGKVLESPQTEKTPFNPMSPYGVAKTFAHHYTIMMNRSYDLYAISGILFNHESPRRGLEFVTRKITYSVANILKGKQKKISLGNLNAERDWGYAPDYIKAMWLMLQQESAKNENSIYVISTGKKHTIREFVEMAFNAVGINIEWKGEGIKEKGYDLKTGNVLVDVNPNYFRPAEVESLVGDSSKAREKLGWEPKINIKDMVKKMVEHDLNIVENKLSPYTTEPNPFLD